MRCEGGVDDQTGKGCNSSRPCAPLNERRRNPGACLPVGVLNKPTGADPTPDSTL